MYCLLDVEGFLSLRLFTTGQSCPYTGPNKAQLLLCLCSSCVHHADARGKQSLVVAVQGHYGAWAQHATAHDYFITASNVCLATACWHCSGE